MTESTLRVGIMGAGSIGCYIGGRLLVAGAADVVLVGRERVRDEIIAHDLTVVDMGSDGQVVAGDAVTYVTDPAKLADCDVVLLCVKSAQTRDTARELATVLRDDAIVISLQNGVRNSETLRAELSGRLVIAGIVTFNVVSQGTGVFFPSMKGRQNSRYRPSMYSTAFIGLGPLRRTISSRASERGPASADHSPARFP